MERQPVTNLNLEIFNPEKGTEKIKTHALGSGIIPLDNPSIALYKREITEKEPDYFMTKRGKLLQERVNKAVYEAIEQKYDLMTGAGKSFWEKQWTVANEQVDRLVHTFAADDTGIYGFLDEVAIAPKPAAVIRYLSAKDTDPRLKFEITRQAGLSFIAADLESNLRSSKERLEEVRQYLASDIFNKKQYPDKNHELWTLHDDVTNEPQWIDDSSSETHDNSIENAHWKKHTQRMRYAGDEIGWVMTNSRIKEGGVNKTIKKAILREQEGEGTHFDPFNDVPDIMGIQFVVKDNFYHSGEKVQKLVKKVKDVLSERFKHPDENGNEIEGIRFEEKNGTTGDHTKSGKFQAYRLMGYFDDMQAPLELMFLGQLDHFMNTHHIGETDEETQKPKGAAHKIMEVDRGILVMEQYFPNYPPDAPKEEKFYGDPKWETIRRTAFKMTTERLRNSHIPSEEINNMEVNNKEVTLFKK